MTKVPASRRQIGWSEATRRRVSPYERIKQAIMSGDLVPGEPLVESVLAERCEVSRTPIREALSRLKQDGLVQRGEHGLVVRESSPDEILDIYETRIVLESQAARVAAERRTSHDLVRMRRVEERVSRVDPTDLDALPEGNREFHRTIWQASHNNSLVDLLERLNLHLGRYPATTLGYADRPKSSHIEHLELIEAISDRDSDRAAAVASHHFVAARDIRLHLWESE